MGARGESGVVVRMGVVASSALVRHHIDIPPILARGGDARVIEEVDGDMPSQATASLHRQIVVHLLQRAFLVFWQS